MKKGSLIFNHVRLRPHEIHKFSGYVGNVFREYDLVHNHDHQTGKPIYHRQGPTQLATTLRLTISERRSHYSSVLLEQLTIMSFEQEKRT